MDCRVVVMEAAERDLDGILSSMAEKLDNRQADTNFLSAFMEKVQALRSAPLMFEVAHDSALRKKSYRKIVIGTYIVLYRRSEDADIAYIARIFYGKRKYQELI